MQLIATNSEYFLNFYFQQMMLKKCFFFFICFISFFLFIKIKKETIKSYLTHEKTEIRELLAIALLSNYIELY